MKTKTAPVFSFEDLSQADLEECELLAHHRVPEDATETEAQDIYATELAKLVAKKRRRSTREPAFDLSELLADEED